MSTVFYDCFDSPIGTLTIAADQAGLRQVLFAQHRYPARGQADWQHAPDAPVLIEPRRQLLQYLHGQRRHFELLLAPEGTPFQSQVWKTLAQIPFASTWSYGQLAGQIGKTQAQQTEGVHVQQALLNAAGQKRADVKVRTVNEAEASSEGPDQVTDKGKRESRPRERSGPGKRAAGI